MTPYQDPIRSADHRVGEALTISLSHSESAGARSVAGDMRKSEESKRKTEYRVLVVNDMPDQLEIIGHLLRKSGYGVVTALNGREGLDVAQAERPDLVISDVSMPLMDGIEMCRSIRTHPE